MDLNYTSLKMINDKFYLVFLEIFIQQSINENTNENTEINPSKIIDENDVIPFSRQDFRNLGRQIYFRFPNPYRKPFSFSLNKYFLPTIWKFITGEDVIKLEEEECSRDSIAGLKKKGFVADKHCLVLISGKPKIYNLYDSKKYSEKMEKIFLMYKNIIEGYFESLRISVKAEIIIITEREDLERITDLEEITEEEEVKVTLTGIKEINKDGRKATREKYYFIN